MTPEGEVLDSCKQDMEKTVAAFRKELSHVRTGRASTALLEGITVDYYGAKTPLNQLATLSAPEATLLVVQPYDKSVIGAIEKAIKASELGLNPLNDGKIIRVPIPALTEERRREYVKMVKQRAEEARVAVRNVRREELQQIHQRERAGEIPEDQAKRAGDQLQKITDTHTSKIDAIGQRKESEVMEV